MAGSIGQPTVGILPWQAVYATSGTFARTQGSTYLGMGLWENTTSATTDYWEFQMWMDAGTWKHAGVYHTSSGNGIVSIQIDGVEVGTLDQYEASGASNKYAEVTGIAVATAGLKTIRYATPTKNASSSNYSAHVNSAAWIRTGA